MDDIKIGTKVLTGGSVGTVEVTGTVVVDGVPTPVVDVRCTDYDTKLLRFRGNQVYALTPMSMLEGVR